MWWKHALYGLGLAIIVGLPTGIALTYYKITGDPSVRPLAQTVDNVVHGTLAYGVLPVGVQLRLHDPETPQALAMAQQLRKTFSAKGIEVQVFLLEIETDRKAEVLFIVDENRIGPFPLSRAADGVGAAVTAYRSVNRR